MRFINAAPDAARITYIIYYGVLIDLRAWQWPTPINFRKTEAPPQPLTGCSYTRNTTARTHFSTRTTGIPVPATLSKACFMYYAVCIARTQHTLNYIPSVCGGRSRGIGWIRHGFFSRLPEIQYTIPSWVLYSYVLWYQIGLILFKSLRRLYYRRVRDGWCNKYTYFITVHYFVYLHGKSKVKRVRIIDDII